MSGNNSVQRSSSIWRFALNFFKKTKLNCRWSVSVAPPATDVYILVDSDTEIDATTAEIFVFQLLNGQEIPITYLTVPFEENKFVEYKWRTQPAKGGNYEAGEYHFRVKVNNEQAETVKPLKLKDVVAKRYESSFENAKKKGPVNIKGE
jgi:hypothetical protein